MALLLLCFNVGGGGYNAVDTHTHGCLVKSQIKCTPLLLMGKPDGAIMPASQSEAQTGCDPTLC